MKKKTYKQRPFDSEIKQMRKEKVILISLVKARPFVEACVARNIDLGVGSPYKGGIILYEK